MKELSLKKCFPNLILILLFEDGRKQGLGLWLIIMAVVLFVGAVNGFGLAQLEAAVALGSSVFTGGNLYDKWHERKKIEMGAVVTDAPGA